MARHGRYVNAWRGQPLPFRRPQHRTIITGIPLEVYDRIVNGKPALEWVMERQSVYD